MRRRDPFERLCRVNGSESGFPMWRHVRLCGGTLIIKTQPGKGVQISARLPLREHNL
jgi:hypothetical protein